MNGIITLKVWFGLVHHEFRPLGIRDTIEAKISSEMPLPIPRWVISSPIHISSIVPAVSVITIRNTFGSVKLEISVTFAWLWKLRNRNTSPIDCANASATVRYRVYWVIRCWPTSPSLESRSSDGTATCRICRMIDAVMYGMIPSAKIASRPSDPPENRLSRPRTLLPPSWLEIALIADALIPGAGM